MTLKKWTSQHKTIQSFSTRQEALWKLISYSICDKTALNELIYLQLPPNSLASCLTDAFSNTSAGKGWWWRRSLVGVVTPRHDGGLWGKWEGRGVMVVLGGEWRGGAGNNRAKQNKQGTENNLKLCIDLTLVIVHIVHSPTGPISVCLKCKGRKKKRKEKSLS